MSDSEDADNHDRRRTIDSGIGGADLTLDDPERDLGLIPEEPELEQVALADLQLGEVEVAADVQQAANDDDEDLILQIDPLLEELEGPDQVRIMADAVTGSQLGAVSVYAGDPKQDIDIWLEQIDNFKTQFQWSDAATASAAKAKLTDKAAFWLSSQRKMNKLFPLWNTGVEGGRLRKALRLRFKPTVTAVEATAAVAGLKQKENETVQEFYDRVIWAVDTKNYKTVDKTTAEYATARDSDIFAFFGAGMKEKIISLAMSGGNPPDTHEELLTRSVNIETSYDKRQYRTNEVTTSGEDGATGGATTGPLDEIKELKKQIAALTKTVGTKRHNRCYRCNQPGHFVRDCTEPPREGGGGGRGRGRGGGKGRGGRGGGQNPNKSNEHKQGGQSQNKQAQNYGKRDTHAVQLEDEFQEDSGNY